MEIVFLGLILLWGPPEVLPLGVLSLSSLPPVQEKGLATGYTPWKKQWMWKNGKRWIRVSSGKPYCAWKKHVKLGDPLVAHRFLKCGTRIHVSLVKAPWAGAWMVVGDHGPYGACVQRGKVPKGAYWRENWSCRRKFGPDSVWYVKLKRRQPGIWRGVLDMSPVARKLIGHNGYQRVILRYTKKRRTNLY